MYLSLLVLIVLIHRGWAIDCPNSSAQWCQSIETARACGVSNERLIRTSSRFLDFYRLNED
jgi:hypothetical protein